MAPADASYDYIVVGSGAGGGTVAARLADKGARVLVIEAGPDPLDGGLVPASHYSVPAFHALASEDPAFCWNQQVSHFDDPAEAELDSKSRGGRVLYPRASALGGCTAHNAMIFLVPPDEDWERLSSATGDERWSPDAMRIHRQAVERCRHRPLQRLFAPVLGNPTGHGWNGWLQVEKAVPMHALSDSALIRSIFLSSMVELGRGGLLDRARAFLHDWGDPNDVRRAGQEQLCYLPLATLRHARTGTRERLRASGAGGRLEIATDTLATRVTLDDRGRATGVEWLSGRHLYRASPAASDAAPLSHGRSLADKEVILAAGAFATPQLLMLSGIGDAKQLRSVGIAPRIDLPEVGLNLQDRYEISLVHRMPRPWRSLRGARFEPGDMLYRQWRMFRRGMYVSNGTAIAAIRRSSTAEPGNPDLMLMGLMGKFKGYVAGYASECWHGLDGFSWTVLKGQTGNRAGTVKLASADPRDPPKVDFHSFAEDGERDLDALLEGVAMARSLAAPLIECGAVEDIPGPELEGTRLRAWVRANAWGHHACGTAAIGSVLDPSGRVLGVKGLRVVDASIFPRIPGLFIVAAIYLAAEKLAADILASR